MEKDDDRIFTIINEIEYWKKHKLLPNEYCDYLLALYTKGEGNDAAPLKHRKFLEFVHAVLILLLLPFSFTVIYFTQFHWLLQLSILIIFLGYSIYVYFFFREKKDNIFYHITLVALLFLLLLTTIQITTVLHVNMQAANVVIILNFLLWYIIGKKKQLKYLMIISIFSLFFIVFYIIS